LKDLLDAEDDSRELQEVVADGFGNVKRAIAEIASDADHTGYELSGKVHEFQGCLL